MTDSEVETPPDWKMKCVECGGSMLTFRGGLICENGCGRVHPEPSRFLPGLIPTGSSVRVNASLVGVVIGILIEPANRVTYHVAFWANDQRKTVWLNEFELQVTGADEEPLTLGFQTQHLTEGENDVDNLAAG